MLALRDSDQLAERLRAERNPPRKPAGATLPCIGGGPRPAPCSRSGNLYVRHNRASTFRCDGGNGNIMRLHEPHNGR